jgi:hypothetical protein
LSSLAGSQLNTATEPMGGMLMLGQKYKGASTDVELGPMLELIGVLVEEVLLLIAQRMLE